MKKTVLLLVIAALMVAGILSPAVSAADTVDGKKIQIGDSVLLGETGLDFTSFGTGSMIKLTQTGTVDPAYQFTISSSVDTSSLSEGTYVFYSVSGQQDVMKRCIIKSANEFPVHAFYDSTGKNKLTGTVDAETGKTFSFILKGKPGVEYDVFKDTSQNNIFSGYLNRTTLSKELAITLPSTPDSITIIAVPKAGSLVNDGQVSFTINVVGTIDDSTTLNINTPSADALNGLFATGDLLYISGTLSPSLASDGKTVYLYLKGVNYPYSGVNLEGDPVIDGDENSFTTTTYSASLNTWTAEWDTSGFEPGTYTVYASMEPYGYNPDRLIQEAEIKSQEYTLSARSIHARFAEENGGTFTQGDYLYAYWSARGSPSEVRWYIIGQNYMETGHTAFPLYTTDQKKGINAPQGVYGFSYDRVHTTNMDAGPYYLVYQHPGFNGRFDVNPDMDGYFTSLTTNFGESASLSGRPSSNCAEVLKQLITDIRSDDLCVISEITIETPCISIDQVEHLAIGDKLKIKGTTNYAGEGVTVDGSEVQNTFSLKINRLNFDLPEENAAMKLQIVNRVVPQNIIPYYGVRTFEFAEIDTSTWFEGTYQALVTNIDTGFEESIMFTVGGEGVEQDSATLQVPSDPLAEPYEELDPLPPIIDYSEPVEPEEPKSPGFLLAPFALAAAFALRRK